MMHLDYKGWRSTRIQVGAILALSVTAAYLFGDVTAAQWIDFLKWDFGTYALSEVGAKGAVAMRKQE